MGALCRENEHAAAYLPSLLRGMEDVNATPIVRLAAMVGYVETGAAELPATAHRWLEKFREDADAIETDIFAKTSEAFSELMIRYEAVSHEGVDAVIQRLLGLSSIPPSLSENADRTSAD